MEWENKFYDIVRETESNLANARVWSMIFAQLTEFHMVTVYYISNFLILEDAESENVFLQFVTECECA